MARLADVLDRLESRLGSPSDETPLLVDIETASKQLSISKQSVERLIRARTLKSKLIGGRRMIPSAALMELATG